MRRAVGALSTSSPLGTRTLRLRKPLPNSSAVADFNLVCLHTALQVLCAKNAHVYLLGDDLDKGRR